MASRATHVVSPRSARFGPFQVDFCTRKLFKNGSEVHLQHHSWQILEMLLARPGEVVTREVLRERLWDAGTFVDFEQGLNTAVMRLRHAIEDVAETPRFIETLPRYGYRFVARVSFSENPAPLADSHLLELAGRSRAEAGQTPGRFVAGSSPAPQGNRLGSTFIWVFGVVATVVVTIFLANGSLRRLVSPSAPHLPTLAVLPFDNLSNPADRDYLAEDLTEQLITELGQAAGLRVLSRGSVMNYAGKHVSLEKAALELQADVILEGSVSSGGGQIRVTANLYLVATRKHLWAQTYDAEVGAGSSPEREIVRDIAQKIQVALARR